jgi:hypothetical protein
MLGFFNHRKNVIKRKVRRTFFIAALNVLTYPEH